MEEKLIQLINSLGVKRVHLEDGTRIKWEGVLPEGKLVAPFANTFISAKNKAAWVSQIEAVVLPEAPKAPEPPAPTLQEVVEAMKDETPKAPVDIFKDMTKRELETWARENHNVELDLRSNRDKLLAQVRGL